VEPKATFVELFVNTELSPKHTVGTETLKVGGTQSNSIAPISGLVKSLIKPKISSVTSETGVAA